MALLQKRPVVLRSLLIVVTTSGAQQIYYRHLIFLKSTIKKGHVILMLSHELD